MHLPLYQVDAFSNHVFGGNPAAVVPLQNWLPDTLMQLIAAENNLAETAFFVPQNNDFHIRWFTPTNEVPLCGHATLAAAHVLFHHLAHASNPITFHSLSGPLVITQQQDWLSLNFPADFSTPMPLSPPFLQLLQNAHPIELHKGTRYYVLILQNEHEVLNAIPNIPNIKNLDLPGLIISAKGTNVDFVSRFFAPQWGVNEDPVTGSAHTTLIPLWSQKLNKTSLHALQLSTRRGSLLCTHLNHRVDIKGQCKTYLVGKIFAHQ